MAIPWIQPTLQGILVSIMIGPAEPTDMYDYTQYNLKKDWCFGTKLNEKVLILICKMCL